MTWLLEILRIYLEAASDKVLRDKGFIIAKNLKYDGYQLGRPSMIYKFVIKKRQVEKLSQELHKPVIRKFEKQKVYSLFKDNIWSCDLADIQLISDFNTEFRFLSCVIDVFSNMHGLFL